MLRRNRYDLAVVGGGVAGLTAAWHAGMRGLSVLLAESSLQPGGQIATAGRISGIPGVALSGTDLATALVTDGSKAGARLQTQAITSIESGHDGFVLRADEDFSLAHNVVLATGGSPRRLDVPGEAEFEGRGVAHCATCDGPLCRGRDVVVVGGGDAALQEALLLSTYARAVTVVVRGLPRARRQYLAQAEKQANLHFVWGAEPVALRGSAGVEKILLRHADGRERGLDCFAVFAKIGCIPASAIAGALVDRVQTGHVVTDACLETRTGGLFAVGAVRAGYGGDLVDAAADGALVARMVAARKRVRQQNFNGENAR
jgi:thioredoxin reductase (NADPH)